MEQLLAMLRQVRPDIDFDNEQALVDDGLLDSMDIVTIISEIDDLFGVQIRISELEPEHFNSAQAILQLVNNLKSRQA